MDGPPHRSSGRPAIAGFVEKEQRRNAQATPPLVARGGRRAGETNTRVRALSSSEALKPFGSGPPRLPNGRPQSAIGQCRDRAKR